MAESYLLGEFVDITSSKRIKRADYVSTGVPFYRSKEVIELAKGKKISTELFISEEQFSEILVKFGAPKRGDILLTAVGTLGVSWQVDDDSYFYFKDGNLIWFKGFDSELDSIYFLYWLRSKIGQRQLDGISIGSTQRALTIAGLKSIPFSPPKLKHQKAIAQILGALDDKIEVNQKMSQTLEEIAKALFKSWFIDFDPVHAKAEGRPTGLSQEISDLFPDELVDSEIGKIPKGWEVSVVSNFGSVICGKTPSTKDQENFGGEYPFITIPDMRGNIFSLTTDRTVSEKGASLLKGKMLPVGSICVSCIATPGLVIITTTNSFTNQQINSIAPHTDKDREYLVFSMMTFGELISSAGSGGSVFSNLSTSKFKELPILKPSEESMIGFSDTVRRLLERVELAQREISTLSGLRDTLLPKLISGELRVPDAEKFLEEAGV